MLGYGNSYPLFEPVPGYPEYLRPSETVAKRYFSAVESVPSIPFDSFKSKKDSATIRVFVQGGSTAAGFPFYFGGSFPDMLEQRLLQTFPGRNIEVVNTAMAAVNSYTLVDFVDEILEQDPDLVLIYAGHNEYYGALGVGSSESLGRTPAVVRAYLSLQDFRVVQALRALIVRLAGTVRGKAEGQRPSDTLMRRMVGEQRIPYGSRLYKQGLIQFRHNLSDILRRYRAAGVPVFIGTVVSNERDHPPFISGLSERTEPDEWNRSMTDARRLAGTDTTAALEVLQALVRTDSLAADPYYLAGRLFDGLHRYPEARRAYQTAKDRDELRFRAPEAINAVIREEAARYGAVVVESERAVSQVSPGGIPGNNVMTEHLHPNIDGYFYLSDAYYAALRESGLIGEWRRPIPTAVARSELLVTPIDSIVGLYRVQSLVQQWPFRPIGAPPARLDTLAVGTEEGRLGLELFLQRIRRLDALDELQRYYSRTGQSKKALQALLAIIQRYPFLPGPYLAAANLLVNQGRLREAEEYCLAALDREQSAEGFRLLGSLQLHRGDVQPAIDNLERAVQLDPNSVPALYNLAGAYALSRSYTRARDLGERVLELNPNHADTRRLLGSLPREN